MGTALSRLRSCFSSSPAAPAATTREGGTASAPAAPEPITSTTSDKKQPEPKRHWVDEKGNNCFVLLPRGLSIVDAEKPSYWAWAWLPPPPGEGSAGDAAGEEVAELKNVQSLEVRGKLELSQLTPGATYEVAFEVMLKQGCFGWQVPVDLQLELPGVWVQERKESLEKKTRGQWLQLKVGDVEVKGQQGGELVVTLSQYGGHWKSGLVVKGIRIAPKN